MSPWLELLPGELKENTALAFRGLSTFLQPTRYINLLRFEKPIVILIRYVIFSIAFSMLQVVVFSSSSRQIPFWTSSIKVLILDATLSIILLPIFWLPLKLLKHENPIRVIYGYMFPLRSIILVPSIIFYALFISTEAYFWAAARGIIFYIAILLLLSIPTFCSFNRLPKKILAIVATFLVYYGVSISISILLENLSHGSNMPTKLLLLYDPIAAEYDENISKFNELSQLNFYPASFKKSCDIVFKATPSADGNTLYLNKDDMLQLRSTWLNEREPFYSKIARSEKGNKETFDFCEFETSKQMLKQDMESISQARMIAEFLDSYAKQPTAAQLSQIIPEYIKLQKSCNARIDLILNHYNNVLPLLKYALLFY